MDMQTIVLSALGGIGIGTIIQVVISVYAKKKELLETRAYKEKRYAYLGLLNSIHNAAVHPSDENSKAYALWQTRVDLFGSIEVSKYAQQIVDTTPHSKERDVAFDNLLSSMRKDLNVRKD